MHERFNQVLHAARAWVAGARQAGWCDDADVARIAAVQRTGAADLFAPADAARPLVVALFGGTGVGKSSLLNRMAGAPVARVGVERPTSHTATVYAHGDVRLAELPPDLPVERTQIARHHQDAYRDVLLIDMPDVDSTAEANRALVLAWLPHIDLVVYVVSPERYRDDVGWRILQQRGQRHGWIFVMNRWDEGDASQRTQFAQMLQRAGFGDPHVLCTCCRSEPPALTDDFASLTGTIQQLAQQQTARELERLGWAARARDLEHALAECGKPLGSAAGWAAVRAAFDERLAAMGRLVADGLRWNIELQAAAFARRDPAPLLQALRATVRESAGRLMASGSGQGEPPTVAQGPAPAAEPAGLPRLWDEWAQAKLDDCGDALEVELRRAGIAAGPARAAFDEVATAAARSANVTIADALRAALARPAGAGRRVLLQVFRSLQWALPLVALLLVGYQVVNGYWRATLGQAPFLDASFALHSLLLILVAWAFPAAAARALRPAFERIARRALTNGLQVALDHLRKRAIGALNNAAQAADELRAALSALRESCNGVAQLREFSPQTRRLLRVSETAAQV